MPRSLPALHRAIVDEDLVELKRLLGTECNINEKAEHATYKWLGTPMHFAAYEGNINAVEELLAAGADVDKKSPIGQTPLHWAAVAGQDHAVMYLIGHSADVHSKDQSGLTPLYNAACSGHASTAELLIEGTDFNHPDKDGLTPLHVAAGNGHVNIVQLLLDLGADVNHEDKCMETSLHCAVRNGHDNVIHLLLDRGADVHHQDKYGWIALHRAAEDGHESVVQVLLDRGADINHQDNYGWIPLHLATMNGHESVVQLLLEKGADISHQDTCGWTPLYRATTNGNEAVVQLLLDKGADINHRTKDGLTPLHVAAKRDHESIVQLLLHRGADPQIKTKTGHTARDLTGDRSISQWLTIYMKNNPYPKNREWLDCLLSDNVEGLGRLLDEGFDVNTRLWYQKKDNRRGTKRNVGSWIPGIVIAVIEGRIKILQTLLDYRCDINVQDNKRTTPLMNAIINKYLDIAQRLIDAGCNVNLKCNKGKTALIYAVETEQISIVNALMVCENCNINATDNEKKTALIYAVIHGGAGIVQRLIEGGCDVNLICRNGQTALMHAAKGGHTDIVNKLIGAKCDITYTDKRNRTALTLAADWDHVDIVKKLIEADNEVMLIQMPKIKRELVENELVNVDGTCALMYGARYGNTEQVDAVIKETKCDINACTVHDGKTALIYACKHGYQSIVRLLLDTGMCDISIKAKNNKSALRYARNLNIKQLLRRHTRSTKAASVRKCSDDKLELPHSPLEHNISTYSCDSTDTTITIDRCNNLIKRKRELTTLSVQPSVTLTMDERYPMRSPPGVAIIINNRVFAAGITNRYGTEVDEDILATSLQKCGFIVHIYNDLSTDNIRHCLDHYRLLDHTRFSSFFCFVLSHGCYGNILGVNGEKIPIIKLTSMFTSERCPTLKDKPKTFILVSCQSNTEDMARFPPENYAIPLQEKHFVVSYSTLPGTNSYRDINIGTPFIRSLTENINKYARERCLTEILRNTNKKMAPVDDAIQMSTISFTSLSACFVMYAPPGDGTNVDDVPRFNVPDGRAPSDL